MQTDNYWSWFLSAGNELIQYDPKPNEPFNIEEWLSQAPTKTEKQEPGDVTLETPVLSPFMEDVD